MSNIMVARKVHEIILEVNKVNGSEDRLLIISATSFTNGRISPLLLIEGTLEELDEFKKRLEIKIVNSIE